MPLFKKKQSPPPTKTELRCPAEGCSFTCVDPVTLKKHTAWKHPELAELVSPPQPSEPSEK